MIINDPWLCHGHRTDLIVVVPLFAGTRPIGDVATAAHLSEWAWDDLVGRTAVGSARSRLERKRLFYPLLNDIGRFVSVCRC